MRHFYFAIQKIMMKVLREKKTRNFLLFGMANALLPCGMVYVALAGALVTPNVTNSVMFMMMFGVGTLPAMIALSIFGQYIPLELFNAVLAGNGGEPVDPAPPEEPETPPAAVEEKKPGGRAKKS